MKIGDRLKRRPHTFAARISAGDKLPPALPGTVVYIHPRGRFFVLRFDCGFCESYFFMEVKMNGEA